MMKELERRSCEERLRELGLFSQRAESSENLIKVSPQRLSRGCGHNEGARVLGTIVDTQPAPPPSLTSSFRQDTPSCAEEDLEQSGSAGTASGGQMQKARPSQAAAGETCPNCLGTTRNTTYVSTCFHAFSFGCIRQRGATRSTCPLCRQPIDRILHTVRADDNSQQHVCRSSARGRRNAARERVRSRSPQHRYDLRPRPSNNGPTAGRRAL
nr:E3 ubiquitin-protein ligase Topors-like [Anser cygnoides]